MIIKSATGVKMTEAVDWLIRETMKRYDVDRRTARQLLGEALVRTCVYNEIMQTEDALIAKGGKKNV